MLRSETRLPILPVKPLGDKLTRAHTISSLVESGRVFLPEQAPWLREFVDEVTSFPAAPHDDQVDAMSQALGYLKNNNYPPFEWSALSRVSHDPWNRSATPSSWATQDVDALDDMVGSKPRLITRGARQMQEIAISERMRYPSLRRRRAW